MSQSPKVLFALAGVGLGNATRCHAIAKRMEDADVHVLAFGNAARFFEDRGGQVHRLLPLTLPKRSLDLLWTLPLNALFFALNLWVSLFWILRIWPQVILVDSEYSSILPGLLLRRTLIGLNNASVVCALWPRLGSPELRVTYWTREVWDALICRLFHRTLVPTFEEDIPLPRNHQAIPPIVRELPEIPMEPDAAPLILRGGSEHLTPLPNKERIPLEEVGGKNPVANSLERIARAPIVICQGGFSSLSEVLALGKVAIAAPLPGHAEQCMSVRSLVNRGALLELELGEDVSDALRRAKNFQPVALRQSFDGAQVVSTILREYIHLSREPHSSSIDEIPRAN